ncbi:alpha/beta hydrolase [Burkholderia sp. NRF60-BP8]|uniref:alpha/beta hydrolase n=1 Tax=Burkholderia sp. NRF60-BP8 TaxID=1637853 RepID=UPI000A50967C|nr:alpha/beta hydrolase [Burkholderia sp. NRF60-BP8]
MDLLHDCVTLPDGTRTHTTRTRREPQRPNLVVMPPPGASPRLLDSALATLGERFNVLSWELRCIAGSPPRNGLPSVACESDMHVGDCIGLLDRYGWPMEGLCCIGYCASAPLAMRLAVARPRLVTRLALVSGAYFLPPDVAPQTQYERDMRRLVAQLAAGPDAVPELYRLCMDSQRVRDDAPAFEQALRYPFRSVAVLHGYALTLAALQRIDTRRLASRIAVPTLVYAARTDRVAAAAAAQTIANLLPAGCLTLAAAGEHHDFPHANPAVVDAVVDFLTDCNVTDCCGAPS